MEHESFATLFIIFWIIIAVLVMFLCPKRKR